LKIIRSARSMKKISEDARKRRWGIGFVPTLGYLHPGHLSLIKRARGLCRVVVVSVYVNPMQFAPREDFSIYPRDPKGDAEKANAAGADYLFYPSTNVMYPKGSQTFVQVENLTRFLCGPFRPSHFRGVTTVVAKLFEIIEPHRAFFGQKDYQQFRVIQQMVKDLHMKVKIEMCPTIREHDGLAMSSRNSYLSPKERRAGISLFRSLQRAKILVSKGEFSSSRIRRSMMKEFEEKAKFKLEYLSICDAQTLQEVTTVRKKTLIALAAWVGKTRLIDNILLRGE